MGWETRNGRQYYYEARKVGGRVIKTYVGSAASPEAQSLAGIVRIQRDRKVIARQRRVEDIVAARVADIDAAAAIVDAYSQSVRQASDAAIIAAGYHWHRRGEWRKQRMGTRQIGQTTAVAKNELTPEQKSDVQAMRLAQAGRHDAVPAMRVALDRAMAENDGKLPDKLILFNQVVARFAERFTPGNDPSLLSREATVREIKMMADDVAGPNPSPLERILAERIAVCYAHVQFAEVVHQTAVENRASQEATTLLLDRIDGAQRRYLAAIKTLAQVQRLKLPTVQLNIGERQINVGSNQVNIAAGIPDDHI